MDNEVLYSNGVYIVTVSTAWFYGDGDAYSANVRNLKGNHMGIHYIFQMDGIETVWWNPLTWFKRDPPCAAIRKAIKAADRKKEETRVRREKHQKVLNYVKNWEENCNIDFIS